VSSTFGSIQTVPLFLLTGENSYALREERKRWIDQFVSKHGAENCTRMDAAGLTIRRLLDDVSVAPFLAPHRLVIVDGVPRATREDIQLLVEHLHPAVILLFIDPKPDQRLSGVKELLKVANVRTFEALHGRQLQQWLSSLAQNTGTSLTPDAFTALIERVGDDQDTLVSEIEKISLVTQGKNITSQDIENRVLPCGENAAYLTDLLARSTPAEVLRRLHLSLERGQQDAFALWNLLLWTMRTLVAVWAAEQDCLDESEMMKRAGVRPQALRSLRTLVKKWDRPKIERCVRLFADADTALKTGDVRATTEDPRELLAIIDQCVLAMK
jgi:DNA polymerase-3 subunit delta